MHDQNWGRDLNLPEAGHGRIIALNEGYGFRPLLSVQSVKHVYAQGKMRDSTLLLGNQLMYLQNMVDLSGWYLFIQQYFNQKLLWNQLKSRKHEGIEEYIYQWFWMGNILEVVPTAQAELTLLNGGWDNVMGFWLQFEGIVPFYAHKNWWDEGPEWERDC